TADRRERAPAAVAKDDVGLDRVGVRRGPQTDVAPALVVAGRRAEREAADVDGEVRAVGVAVAERADRLEGGGEERRVDAVAARVRRAEAAERLAVAVPYLLDALEARPVDEPTLGERGVEAGDVALARAARGDAGDRLGVGRLRGADPNDAVRTRRPAAVVGGREEPERESP